MKQRIETIDDSPILIIKRDKPIAKVEEVKIINNIAILSECPYHFTKVRIKDMVEIPENVYRDNKAIQENQYIVDYKFGFITFNPAMEGKTLTIEYEGTGTVLIPSSRIYDTNRKDVIVTLQEMIDGGRKAIEAYGNIDNAIKIAEEEYAKINTSIEEGKKTNNNLNITIISAKDINKILEGNIDKANNVSNTLNGNIESGTNKIQEMDNKINEVDSSELIRKSNEEERRNSENIRISNESERKSNEIIRENNEETRVSTENRRVMAELLRKENEDNRKSDENVRIDNENKRIQSETIRETNEKDRQNTNTKITNTINDFSICEEYNENKEYKKFNRVTYSGSLYECKYGNVGILPTDKNCWICIAEKGKDGKDGLGSGNMHTSTYDKNENGIVDKAEAITDGTNTYVVNDIKFLNDRIKSYGINYDDFKLNANMGNVFLKNHYSGKHICLQSDGKLLYNNEELAFKEDVSTLDKNIKEIDDKIKNVEVPVKSVNGKTGDVNLTAKDIICINGKSIEEELGIGGTSSSNNLIEGGELVTLEASSNQSNVCETFDIKNGGLTSYTNYTLSFGKIEKMYGSATNVYVAFYNQYLSDSSISGVHLFNISNEKQSYTFKVEKSSISKLCVFCGVTGQTGGNGFKFHNIQLEKGNSTSDISTGIKGKISTIESQLVECKNNYYTKTETDNKFATKDELGNINVPVTKVNGKTGNVTLEASDIIVTELATTVEDAILNNFTSVDGVIGDIKNLNEQLAENTKQINTKMDRKIKDDTTNKKYELGIKNGLLYYREV